MSEAFIGEVRMVGFRFAPRDWAECYGQTMDPNQNMSLFSLLFNKFGGDGRTSFNLPDFRGRTPIHPSWQARQGTAGGAESVALSQSTMAEHTHTAQASAKPADLPIVLQANVSAFGSQTGATLYADPIELTSLHSTSVTACPGSSLAHNNMQPSIALKFIIALTGLYPSRS